MITMDFVVLVLSLLSLFSGVVFGGGRYLRFISRGITGKIMSVIICYFIFGIVLSWGFVGNILDSFKNTLLAKDIWILNILVLIRIDIVVFAIVLFIVVQILRKFVISVIADIFESDNKIMFIVNKALGIVLAVGFTALLFLLFLQFMRLVDGTDGEFVSKIAGSTFKIDYLFNNNPLNSIINRFID